jgi:hypothetical protein
MFAPYVFFPNRTPHRFIRSYLMATSFGKRWLSRLQSRVRTAGGQGQIKGNQRAILRVEALEARDVPANFTAGNIAVLQLANTTNNTTGSILELSPSTANQSSPVQTISIAATGINAIRFSDSGTSSFLSDTNDGSLLAFAAYNTTDTTDSDLATVTANDPASDRAVGTLNNAGSFTLQTTYTGISTNQARSATSLDNSSFFITDKGGLYTNGATSASLTTNILDARSFGGTVYVSSTKASAGVSTVSSPTATSLTALPGLPADGSIQDFYLIQSGSNGFTYDILYTLDQNSSKTGAATINKYSLVSGTWTANGTYSLAGNATAMIAAKSGGGASLYVVTTAQVADNSLVRLTDTAGYNATIAITTANNVTLYTATGTGTLKGLDIVPQPTTATTTAISSITPTTVNTGQAVSFTATVSANSGSTAPTGGFVEFFNGGTGGTLLAKATTASTSGTTATYSVSTTSLPAGNNSTIQAFYFGNTGFSQSHSSTFGSTLTVNAAIGTTTAITSITPLISNVGTAITFSATVMALTGSSAPGAGSVAFYDGGTSGTLLATATSETNSGTTATFTVTTNSVPAGNYSAVQAFYTPSTGFGSSNSSVFASTLQVNIPGIIAAWTFPTKASPPDNSPAPTLGSGTAITLGMTNNLTNANGTGNTANDDVLSTSGTADPNFTENLWRIRGTPNNGWALSAPQYSQGIELDTSTVGFSNIVFSFDWYSTTQGIRDLQVQYNTNTTNPNGWVNYSGPSSSTGDFIATSNDYYNAQLSPVNPAIHIDFSSISAANNDPNFGVRLVSAYDSTGTLGNVYASAASPPGDIIPYNNSSGNWRFGNLIFQAGITTSTTVAANPPGGQSPNLPVTFSATVTPSSGSQYPAGTIAFYDGNNQIGTTQTVQQVGTTNMGTASVVISNLMPGVHPDITAQYTPTQGNGFIGSGSSMNQVAGDPTDNPISYTINAPQATGVDISPVVGQPFSGLVATFSDGTFTTTNGFSASINWGDTNSSTGVLAFTATKAETNINGQTVNVSLFTVTGTNTYATTGSFPMSITITDPNGNTATVTPTARVAYAPLAVSPVSSIVASAGIALNNQTVATFTDPGLVANLLALGINDPTTQFSASISWGDGSQPTAGTISYNSTTHIFSVIGSHTYSQTGSHTISVGVTPLTLSVERIDSSDPSFLNPVGDENGDGLTDSPSNNFIDQFVIGAANQSAPLFTTSLPDVATSGGNEALTNSSYSVSEGEMTLSTNGQYLVLGGYNDTVSAWAPQQTFSNASVINRVIGRVDGNSNIDTTTALTDTYSGDNFRGVVSTDGTQFWTSGHATDSSSFVHYAAYGASTSTIITGPSGASNINTIEIFNGQLYEGVRSTSGSLAGIFQVGTGLPTTAGQSQTLFIEVPQSNPLDITSGSKPMSPFGFWMTDLPTNPNSINGVNVAYVADAEMGIARYDYNGSTWQFSYYIDGTGTFKDSTYNVMNDGLGTVTPTSSFDPTNPIPSSNPNADPNKVGGVRGLTGRIVNGQVQLFAVSGFGTDSQPHPGGSLIEVSDPESLTVPSNFLNMADAITTLATNPSSSQATSTTNINASELTSVAFSPTAIVSNSVTVLTKVTNQVGLSQSGPVYSRSARTSTMNLTITNNSTSTLNGPFAVVLSNLTSGVTLQSASVTVNGKSVSVAISSDGAGHLSITIPTSVAASLAPGQSLPAITLVFGNPSDLRFSFGTDLYSDVM